MNAESLDVALKSLWGATRWPGFSDSTVVVASPAGTEALRRLHQLVAVHSSGLIHGPHGIGKSFLVHRWMDSLSPKQYRVLRLTHSSLMGSDLLRQMVSLAGKKILYRRGDNVLQLHALWQEWASAVCAALAQLSEQGLVSYDRHGYQLKLPFQDPLISLSHPIDPGGNGNGKRHSANLHPTPT